MGGKAVSVPTLSPAPRAVRIVGILVGAQGLAGLAFAVAVLVRALSVTTNAGNLYGEAGFFGLLAAAILALAAGLIIGRRWTRTPATVLQLLLIAVAWYAIGPTKLVVPAIITVAVCVAALVLLFTAPARAWAVDTTADR
jgi:hypothetical protein